NADGVSYDALIAKEEEPVAEQKKELERLEKSVQEQKKELKEIARRQRGSGGRSDAWSLFGLLGPSGAENAAALEERKKELEDQIAPALAQMKPRGEAVEPADKRINQLRAEWKSRSALGWMGHAIEPVVRPLGWDWRIGMAALASFPAREVVVGTLGIIYNLGEVKTDSIRESEF